MTDAATIARGPPARAAVFPSPRRSRSASCSGSASCSPGCARTAGATSRRPGQAVAVLPFENLGAARRVLRRRHHRRGARQAAALPGSRSSPGAARASTGRPPRRRRRSAGSWGWTTCSRAPCGGRRGRRHEPGAREPRAGPGSGTAATTWQQPFDAALTDVFQVQADIAGRVAEALDVALGARAEEDDRRAADRRTSRRTTRSSRARKPQALGVATCGGPSRDRLLRAGGGARLGVRAGLGAALAGTLLHLQHGHAAPADAARPATRRSGRGARTGAGGDPARARRLPAIVRDDAPAALAAYQAGLQDRAGRRRPAQRHRPRRAEPGRWEASAERLAKANASIPARCSTRAG